MYKKILRLFIFFLILLLVSENVSADTRLKECVEGKISVVAGPSGAGKSSLINCINPDFNLATGEISRKIERGKHTTRHAELMEVFHNSYILHSHYGVQGLQRLHNFKYIILFLFQNSHPKKRMISHCNFDWHFHDDY